MQHHLINSCLWHPFNHPRIRCCQQPELAGLGQRLNTPIQPFACIIARVLCCIRLLLQPHPVMLILLLMFVSRVSFTTMIVIQRFKSNFDFIKAYCAPTQQSRTTMHDHPSHRVRFTLCLHFLFSTSSNLLHLRQSAMVPFATMFLFGLT